MTDQDTVNRTVDEMNPETARAALSLLVRWGHADDVAEAIMHARGDLR